MERIIAAFSGIDVYLAIAVAGWVGVLISCFIDLWDAVATAKVLGERIRSHKVRKTIEKFAEYWRPQVMCLLTDIILFPMSWYEFPWFSIGLSVVEIGIEMRSVYEHQKRRKSKAAEIPLLVSQIISATNDKDAKSVLQAILQFINEDTLNTNGNEKNKLQK